MIQNVTSVEKVLNSRCSCDIDENPKKNHWGMFVKDRVPSQEIIQRVIETCKVPQFSDGKPLQWFEEAYLILAFEKPNDQFQTRLLNIESGMLQEAVYLTCTALGIGTCIHNLGINGTEYGNKIMTTKQLILETRNSYGTEKFSTVSPGPERSFKNGKNLREPKRDGDTDCLKIMKQLTLESSGIQADETHISQLLWAAKGRTPHYVKSHPWGLTIPTWGGGQNYTRIHFVEAGKLFRYVNWTTSRYIDIKTRFFPWWIIGNPTHDLKYIKNVDTPIESHAASFIILSRNETTNRALWEIGYMLENMLLQAKSLGIFYETKVFTDDEIEKLERNGISGAVAALVL